MEELLKELKLNKIDFNQNQNGDLEYNLGSSDSFMRMYARLDKSELVEEDPNLSALTTDRSTITFIGDNYKVLLQSDFDSNEYDIVIKEEA